MPGKLLGVLITGGVGAAIAVIGWLIWKKEKLSLLHDYHVRRVSPENKSAFCRLTGAGLLIVGIGLLITAAILGVTDSARSFLCFVVFFAAGMALLITAGIKYNR